MLGDCGLILEIYHIYMNRMKMSWIGALGMGFNTENIFNIYMNRVKTFCLC